MENAFKKLLFIILVGGLVMLAMPKVSAELVHHYTFDIADISDDNLTDVMERINLTGVSTITENHTDCVSGECFQFLDTSSDVLSSKNTDYLTGNFTGAGHRTITFWIRLNNTMSAWTGSAPGYFSYGGGGVAELFTIGASNTPEIGNLRVYHSTYDYANVRRSDLQEWTFIAVKINGTESGLYLNASHNDSISFTPNTVANNFYVGLNIAGSKYTSMYIDDLKLYNHSMQQAEIQTLYNSYDYPADTTPPAINTTLNDTSLSQNDGVNITANVSDNKGLSFCSIIINQTGANEYFNFSLSGTSDECSQNFTINGDDIIINFTVKVNDTLNNFNQSSIFITTGDTTVPTIHNINFSTTSIVDGNKINLTINTSDLASNLYEIRFNFTDPNGNNWSRANPTYFSIPTTKNYILNYTFFSGQETSVVGVWNLTYVGVADVPNNLVERYPNMTFTVTSAPSDDGGPPSGGGGGVQVIIEEVIINETIIETLCNFNGICEGWRGEDFINCGNEKAWLWDIGGDCAPEWGAIFGGSETRQFIWRGGLVSKVMTIGMAISLGLLIIIASLKKEDFKKFKTKTKNVFKEVRF